VKSLDKKTRQLNIKETKALQLIKSTAEKESRRGYKLFYFIIAAVVGVAFVYLANTTNAHLLVFLFAFVAVLCLGFIILVSFAIRKDFRKAKRKIAQVTEVLRKGEIEVFPVNANRIAVSKEFQDEGDLYAVEIAERKVLFLWDYDHNLKKSFPCLEFEIYSDAFYNLIGRQLNPISEKCEPITITRWAHVDQVGGPGRLTIEEVNFDEIVGGTNLANGAES
jgi:hypothetical protein